MFTHSKVGLILLVPIVHLIHWHLYDFFTDIFLFTMDCFDKKLKQLYKIIKMIGLQANDVHCLSCHRDSNTIRTFDSPIFVRPNPFSELHQHTQYLSNYWWQKSDIWSQASYRYPISWEAFLDPSDSYFLFVDFVHFYTHLTYICICTFFVAFF